MGMLSGKAVTPLDLKSSIVSLKLAFKYYGFVNLQIVVIFIKSSNTAVLGAPIFLLYGLKVLKHYLIVQIKVVLKVTKSEL